MKFLKRYYILIGILLLLAAITLTLFFISPTKIVEYVGVENSYIVVFIMAAVGGLSTLTGTSFFTAIATFSTGGSDPLLLGLFGGLGIFISDTVFFHLAQYGKESIPEKWNTKINRFAAWTKRVPAWVSLLAIYIYLGFTPLPNDLLMIALVVAGFSYKKIFLVLLAGSITIATLVAYLARLGVALF